MEWEKKESQKSDSDDLRVISRGESRGITIGEITQML